MSKNNINNIDIEELSRLHVNRGGQLTWHQIAEYYQLLPECNGEMLRKRVQRYEKNLQPHGEDTDYSSKRRMNYRGIESEDVIIARENNDTQAYYYREPDEPPYKKKQSVTYEGGLPYTVDQPVHDNSQYSPAIDIPREAAAYIQLLERENLRLRNKKAYDEEMLYEPYPEHLDDTDVWEAFQEQATSKSESSFMFWSDLHLPDEDAQAIDLALKLLTITKPDALIFGGDVFDFDSLGAYAKQRRRKTKDALKEVKDRWWRLQDAIDRANPNIARVMFRGNHEDRLDRNSVAINNPFPDTMDEAFVEMVRADDRVWWLGDKQETHFGRVFMQHGKRVGPNAAANASKDFNGNASALMQGHNHHYGMIVKRSNRVDDFSDYEMQASVSIGALCNIPAHYIRDTRMSTWTQGIGYGHNVDGRTNIQNICFHRSAKKFLWTGFGKDIVKSYTRHI